MTSGAAVRGDRRAGERHEEGARIGRLRARLAQPAVDDAVEFGSHAEPAVTLGEVHPGQAGVEACPTELMVVQLTRVVGGEQRIDGFVHALDFGVAGDVGVFENGHRGSVAHPTGAVSVRLRIPIGSRRADAVVCRRSITLNSRGDAR